MAIEHGFLNDQKTDGVGWETVKDEPYSNRLVISPTEDETEDSLQIS